MDDLGAKGRPAWRHPLLVAVEHGLDEAALPAVGDLPDVPPQAGRLRQVPEQHAARRRMEEAAQGEVEPRVGGAVVAHRGIGEIRGAGAPAGAPFHALEQAHEVRSVGALDRGAVGRRARDLGDRAGARDRQLGVDPRDVQDRLGLEVERRRLLAEVGDLQHAGARLSLHEEGLVALAAEISRRALEAEQLGGDPGDVVGAEAGRRRLEDGGHRSILSAPAEIDPVRLLAHVAAVDDGVEATLVAHLRQRARRVHRGARPAPRPT